MNKYSSYILFLLISVLIVILYVNDFGPMSGLQQTIDDYVVEITSPEGTRPNVVLVTIDRKALNQLGDWPWNRDLIADLMAAVASAEPKAMLADIFMSEDAYQDSAGFTDILAEQMSWMDKTIVPYDIALSTYRSSKTSNPDYLFNHSLKINNPLGLMKEEASLQARKVFLPAEKLLRTNPYLGFNYSMPDEDRLVRYQPLILNYEGYYYPSSDLMAAAVYLGVPADQIEVIESKEIQIGKGRTIPIDKHGQYYIRHAKKESFRRYSAATVLEEGFRFDLLRDKLVIITVDDFGQTEIFKTPINNETEQFLLRASVAENIINDNMITRQTARTATHMIILFAIGALCAFVLPQVNLVFRFLILIIGLFVLSNVNYFMVSSFKLVPQTVYMFLELVLFAIACPFLDTMLQKQGATTEEKTPRIKKPPKIKKNQAQADFSQEEIPVREITTSQSDPENVNTTAISQSGPIPSSAPTAIENIEHDHQAIDLDVDLSDAAPVDDKTGAFSSQSTDEATIAPPPISQEIAAPMGTEPKAINLEAEPVQEQLNESPSIGGQNFTDSAQFSQTGETKNLGRYQVLGVLGKGAMGLVYKGVDPAINRPVALKTIRLDFVNDPEEMEELRERLYREAQAAGSLSHPNIVTIYDVGSEGPLQYIAMELLEGRTLEDMIKKKVRFNYRIIAQIIMQICSALSYAHEQNIVHRDIKPANLMVLSDYRVKVMDYGIARVDSNSMTKTGIAMGTPNYISPEQLQGTKIDHRADLFSLGVVMYELLLGKRPFRGENITSLIYSVLNHEPDKPSNVNPQIPLLFDHIVGRTLKKDPDERYQKASEIMADLSAFVDAFSTKD